MPNPTTKNKNNLVEGKCSPYLGGFERKKNNKVVFSEKGLERSETRGREQTKGVYNFPYRIYYEDTDAGGVVYYANYLKFFERARTDFLRQNSIVQSDLAKNFNIVFVVNKCQIDYLKPARLDDLIEVSVVIKEIQNASITIEQKIKIAQQTLCTATIKIVCVDKESFRPQRIPDHIKTQLVTI